MIKLVAGMINYTRCFVLFHKLYFLTRSNSDYRYMGRLFKQHVPAFVILLAWDRDAWEISEMVQPFMKKKEDE